MKVDSLCWARVRYTRTGEERKLYFDSPLARQLALIALPASEVEVLDQGNAPPLDDPIIPTSTRVH